jgi:hypothetical protein
VSPAGFAWPPRPSFLDITSSLDLPRSVNRGTTLVYRVTLVNNDSHDYSLVGCPDYEESLGSRDIVSTYQLNCAPVGVIHPGDRIPFEMRLVIPPDATPGQTPLLWSLNDGRVALGANSEGSIEVR